MIFFVSILVSVLLLNSVRAEDILITSPEKSVSIYAGQTNTLDILIKNNRDIKDTFKQFYGMDLSHETIRLWIQKFSNLIDKYTETLTPEISDKFHVDEQKCKDKHGNWQWVWNCIDADTRYLIANNVTKGRTIPEARQIYHIRLIFSLHSLLEILVCILLYLQDCQRSP